MIISVPGTEYRYGTLEMHNVATKRLLCGLVPPKHICAWGTGKGGVQVVALGFLTNEKNNIMIINRSKKGACSIGKLGRP